ncbi:hypothetical protein CVD25_15900 [Bacillus canaveralius]|uniref:DUF2651 domain-containing protein n=1 Tax=Bacillus canaveralius TaxID=1403243 RepID=A0A2N5GGZ9_9BACI|nr:hypothetical protein [Bacillus canaveralius]PLR80027.1 hypothetical protein CU635_19915 [Bacillus canaveralius]PLR94943.1 hypothetical protein CVD25_15900 [Bacillus canaveralius]
MNTFEILLLFNPVFMFLFGIIFCLVAPKWWKWIPFIIFILSLVLMLTFQRLSYDSTLVVYAFIYSLLSLVGAGIVIGIKKVI